MGIPHDACVDQPGVCDYGQSEDEAESDNVLDEDVPAEEAQGEEAAPMEAEAEEPPITLAVRLPTGSVLPVRVSRTYNTGVLLERNAGCRTPPSVAWGWPWGLPRWTSPAPCGIMTFRRGTPWSSKSRAKPSQATLLLEKHARGTLCESREEG